MRQQRTLRKRIEARIARRQRENVWLHWLYQVNAQLPAGVQTGDAVPLTLISGGVSSNTVAVAIQ